MAQPPIDPLRVVSAEFFAGAQSASDLPPPIQLEIAFAGRSNVGKSSLLNALTGRKSLARTSSTPGCTRQVSLFRTRAADGAELVLADLPGYGYAKRSKSERAAWGTLIEDYLLGRPTLRAVAILVDVRRGLEAEEHDLLRLLAEPAHVARPPLAAVIVATKLDKVPSNGRKLAVIEAQNRLKAFLAEAGLSIQSAPFVATSVDDPTSIQALWRQLRRVLGLSTGAPAK